MTDPGQRIRYDEHGRPAPLGVRAAAVKMALIVAETDRGESLTDAERKIVTAVGEFFGDEYERISTSNDDLTRQLAELSAKLLEIARLAQTDTHHE